MTQPSSVVIFLTTLGAVHTTYQTGTSLTLKDKAQTALFKDPVRTAL